MTSSARSFRDLVNDAHEGKLKLPAFQRKWRWRTDKVIKLFDSLRQRYPIGALLFLKGENDLLAPRTFEGAADSAEKKTADFLVLDGQQRLTAGIHLLHATGTKQYYLRLDRLLEMIAERKVTLTDKKSTESFAQELDETDGYLTSRISISDPRSLLIKADLLCTSILADSTELNVAMADYVKAHPDRADFVYRLILPYFNLTSTDTVPVIEIEAATQIESISRIFTTLNTTGQLLTPFELVVSILYPQKIDLSQDISDFRASGTYYSTMDKTGEVLLQTIAMIAGKDPKKANLPKTINADIYSKYKDSAYTLLERLGKFLTDKLGAGLDMANVDLVPYDAVFAPMALALGEIESNFNKSTERISAEKKLERWYVGSALTQRYQEGVHNKQTRDLSDFLLWLVDDCKQPIWIADVTVPKLIRHSPNGAIGKLIRGFYNLANPKDPSSDRHIGFKPGSYQTEKHHIFPIKYLPTLADWKKSDQGDLILNMMFLEGETNKRWINGNPADHFSEAIKYQGEIKVCNNYRLQFIDQDSIDILRKPTKAKKDFDDFLAIREKAIQSHLASTFSFPISGTEQVTDEMNEEI